MTQQQHVLAWLKDAHAMEQGGILTLENHAATAHDYPKVQAKLHAHAKATRRHAELVKKCIERLGGHPSVLKEAFGTVMGKVQGVANLPAQDTVVKNALGDLAAENFEIASYRSLIAAAAQIGDEETANVCRLILREEEEMASWLASQIPIITRQYLAQQTGEADSSVRAQVIDKAKQKAKELSEQAKELASKAKQKGAGVQARVIDRAKELAEELEEQGEELALKAKQKSTGALITSGALLVGAGVGMLVVQALRSRSGEAQGTQDPADGSAGSRDAYNDVRAGFVELDASEDSVGLSAESASSLDLRSESLDLGEPFVQDAELTELETQPVNGSGETAGDLAESFVTPGFQCQEQNMDDLAFDAGLIGADLRGDDVLLSDSSLSPDGGLVDAELAGGDVQSADDSSGSDTDVVDPAMMRSDVRDIDVPLVADVDLMDAAMIDSDLQDVDGLLDPDTELVDARLMDTLPGSTDALASLDASSVGDVELPAEDVQDVDELTSLDADPADTALLVDDAQADVDEVSAVAYTEVWLIPGPYSGRGPTGYDSAGDPTGQEVYSRLTQHGQVDASNIEIIIDNGEVLLDGTVDSEETKRLAQEAVETITGVRSVQNLLQVQANKDS